MDLSSKRLSEGALYFAAFMLCVPIANYLIQNIGTFCVPDGPCLIPVGMGLTAPSGVLVAGLALVFRDLVQRRLGFWPAVVAILLGSALSAFIAPPQLVIASGVAFLLAEIADLLVFTPLQKRGLVTAVVASSLVGLVVDSAVFLQLAFGSLKYLPGQVVGKAWMVLFAIPFIYLLRRRDERIGMEPA